MIIKVEVDLSEFYSDGEEGTFSQQIKDAISYDVRQKVLADWREKMKDDFTKAVAEEVGKQKEFFITGVLNELVVTAKVKKRYNSNDMISIADYIKEELERTHLQEGTVKNYLNEISKKAAESIGKELKDRYDMLFASQIVSNLNKHGMLKDDVAKLLLKEQGD